MGQSYARATYEPVILETTIDYRKLPHQSSCPVKFHGIRQLFYTAQITVPRSTFSFYILIEDSTSTIILQADSRERLVIKALKYMSDKESYDIDEYCYFFSPKSLII